MLIYNEEMQTKIDEYRRNSPYWTQRQLAEAERDLWETMSRSYGVGLSKVIERRLWLKQLFNGATKAYEARATLLAQRWAQPLWDHMETGMSLWVARDHFHMVKKCDPEARDAVLAARLAPHVPKKLAAAPPVAEQRLSKTAKADFIQCVEALWDADLEELTRNLDSDEVAHLKEDSFNIMREVHKAARRRLLTLRKRSNEREAIRKRVSGDQFAAACGVLNLKIRFGEDVDLGDVRRKAAKTAGALHPDRSPDPTGVRTQQYRQVIEARETLEQYQEERSK